MKIELLKPWGDVAAGGRILQPGAVLDVSDGVGQMWINRGRAKLYVPPEPPKPERKAKQRARANACHSS